MNNAANPSSARNPFGFLLFPTLLQRYQNTPFITPFVSHRFAFRLPQLLSFDIVPKNTRGRGSLMLSSRHSVRTTKSRSFCRSEKSACKSFEFCRSKFIALKTQQNQQMQKNRGVSPLPLPALSAVEGWKSLIPLRRSPRVTRHGKRRMSLLAPRCVTNTNLGGLS
jgi:hypothetical protein